MIKDITLEFVFNYRHYLANTHTEVFNKIVLETTCRGSGDECPFARSSIALTKVLCEIFRIGEPPTDQQGKFYPFIFQHVSENKIKRFSNCFF